MEAQQLVWWDNKVAKPVLMNLIPVEYATAEPCHTTTLLLWPVHYYHHIRLTPTWKTLINFNTLKTCNTTTSLIRPISVHNPMVVTLTGFHCIPHPWNFSKANYHVKMLSYLLKALILNHTKKIIPRYILVWLKALIL